MLFSLNEIVENSKHGGKNRERVHIASESVIPSALTILRISLYTPSLLVVELS